MGQTIAPDEGHRCWASLLKHNSTRCNPAANQSIITVLVCALVQIIDGSPYVAEASQSIYFYSISLWVNVGSLLYTMQLDMELNIEPPPTS